VKKAVRRILSAWIAGVILFAQAGVAHTEASHWRNTPRWQVDSFARYYDKKHDRGALAYLNQLIEFMIIRRPGFDRQGLSNTDILAIVTYTGNDFYFINHALRSGSDLESVLPHVFALDEALAKLPDYVGDVKRGTDLPENVLAIYQPGNIVSDPAFLSTSKKTEYSGPHRLLIHSKTGKDISTFSNFGSEDEVLFRPDVKFRVIKRTTTSDHVIEIELDEVD
jgi:hypothetical protein